MINPVDLVAMPAGERRVAVLRDVMVATERALAVLDEEDAFTEPFADLVGGLRTLLGPPRRHLVLLPPHARPQQPHHPGQLALLRSLPREAEHR